jgi:hypothetical protein
VIRAESGSCIAASSSSVRLTPTMSSDPPASDMTIAFWPPGETSSMSIMSGYVWLKPFSRTSTSLIEPDKPETVQFDG